MGKLDNKNINSLKDQIEINKLQFQINSIDEVISLKKLIRKYHIDIDLISLYLNDALDTYIKFILKALSSNKVSVSEYY